MNDYHEQRRLAQQRYRQRHADELRKARRIAHLLTRRVTYNGDIKELVKLIRDLVGRDYAHELGRALVRRK